MITGAGKRNERARPSLARQRFAGASYGCSFLATFPLILAKAGTKPKIGRCLNSWMR
jgi:hypothetical protein